MGTYVDREPGGLRVGVALLSDPSGGVRRARVCAYCRKPPTSIACQYMTMRPGPSLCEGSKDLVPPTVVKLRADCWACRRSLPLPATSTAMRSTKITACLLFLIILSLIASLSLGKGEQTAWPSATVD
jgi:hypothetical protein